MKKISIVFLLLAGCQEGVHPEKHSIKIEEDITKDGFKVFVEYQFDQSDNNPPRICIRNSKELKIYKGEIEFLLEQLNELEKRFEVVEDKSGKVSTAVP